MVAELKKRYTFDVEIVKKTDTGVVKRIFALKFPSVEIDGERIAEARDITIEELEQYICQRC
ncbi:MAG TPA: hypothetical protein VFG09_01835 [Thermodesulfovibrionales bacterium]|nr:hypothetical protein [Thermodesulfovibrionales bacterium]